MIPFAVVGSERTVIIDGKPVRCRKNRWGVVNVEDERHCEFVYLRNFLTRYVLPRPPLFTCSVLRQCDTQDTPPGPHRDDGADPLRGLPVKTAPRAQGADQRAPVGRRAVSARLLQAQNNNPLRVPSPAASCGDVIPPSWNSSSLALTAVAEREHSLKMPCPLPIPMPLLLLSLLLRCGSRLGCWLWPWLAVV